MTTIFKAAVAAASLCFGFGAHAATVEYEVTGTVAPSGTLLGLWIDDGLDGGDDDIYGISETGSMTINMDGTATFFAKSRDVLDPTTGFDLAFELDDNFSFPGGPSFKSVFGAVEHGNESYLELRSGVMTGVGALAGLDLGVSLFPTNGEFAFQLGGGILAEKGANQHTPDFGMSGWFQITSVLSATCPSCDAISADNSLVVGSQADVNVDLALVSAVPLPAGGMLLLTGLGLFGALRMRRT